MATRRPLKREKEEKITEKEEIATIVPGASPKNDTKGLAVPG